MSLDHTRYFGSTLFTLAWLYHNHAAESEKQELAEAYVAVEQFQRDQWGEDAPRSIENVEKAKDSSE